MVWNISIGQSSSEIFKDRWWNYEMKSKWKLKHIGPSLESSSYLNVTLRYLGPLDHRSFGRLDLLTLGPLGLLDIRTLGPPPPPPPISSSYLFLLPLPTMVWYGGLRQPQMTSEWYWVLTLWDFNVILFRKVLWVDLDQSLTISDIFIIFVDVNSQ